MNKPENALREVRACTFYAKIFMAGSVEHAKQICRKYCYDVGLCVTVDPTTYIYRGGEEAGFQVTLINYPRFPKRPDEINAIAENLASLLRDALAQHSYSIMTPTETVWRTWRADACNSAPLEQTI